MNHNFNVEIAIKYGVCEAILLENIAFWIIKNKASERHYYDGSYWTYNSTRAFNELFPYWSNKQIERIIKSLISNNLIKTGNYNSSLYDRTQWFAFTDIGNSIYPETVFHLPKRENGNDQKGKPIPDNNTYINTDINTDITPFISPQIKIDRFNKFWEAYPKKIGKGAAEKSFEKYKPNDELLIKFIKAIEEQKKSPQWKDVQFIPNPATWLNQKRWEDEFQLSTSKTNYNDPNIYKNERSDTFD